MSSQHEQGSHLFLVRFWSEEVGDREELRGRVQHVLSGEVHIFDNWPTLIDLLLEMAETAEIKAETQKDNSQIIQHRSATMP